MSYFSRVPIRYRTVLITAGGMATLFLGQAYMHHFVFRDLKQLDPFNWWHEAPVPYLNFFFWALLCPLVYSILRRWPFSVRPLLPTLLTHVGLGLVIATFHEVITSTIYYGVLQSTGDFDFADPKYRDWAYHALAPAIFSRTMEYWVLMGVLIALDHARMRREEHEQFLRLRNELQVTQLNALKKQLRPHFLFNTLNTVSALMDDNVGDARKVLSRLGQLLRMTLDKTQRDKVTLDHELDYIGNYLDIEAIRYRDRLKVTYDIDDDLRTAEVPSMVLQPLVENAIKHGPDATTDRVDITIRAASRNGRMDLEVVDNGKGCDDVNKAMEHGGIGLRNVRERVRLLYNGQATFTIGSPQGRGFHAKLSLPIKLNGTSDMNQHGNT